MANWVDQFLKIQKDDSAIDEIMKVYIEAAKVHEQAIIAMGQQPTAVHSKVASTKVVVNLTPDLSSEDDRQ